MIRNSLLLSLVILCSLNGSDREELIASPLKREERLNLASSKEELDKEVEEYFKIVKKPTIQVIDSDFEDEEDFN